MITSLLFLIEMPAAIASIVLPDPIGHALLALAYCASALRIAIERTRS